LSQDEFDQLVRLTARYFLHDVDQFDHWLMPGPEGDTFYVDFGWGPLTNEPEFYRPMWPTAEPGQPAWALWRVKPDASREEVARYATAEAANAYKTAWDDASARRRDGVTFVVTPAPPT
jgi:hypothetical protein